MEKRKCPCGNIFLTWPCRAKVYCSHSCSSFQKMMSEKRKSNNPGSFKGRVKKCHNLDIQSYNTLHHWIVRHFKKSGTCEKCGRKNLKGKFINWASKTGVYDRKRKNWIRLCRKCHYWHDTDAV